MHRPSVALTVTGVAGQAVKEGGTQALSPLTAKSYDCSLQSLLLIVIVAFCMPVAMGEKVTVKAAELFPATVVGAPLTTKRTLFKVIPLMVSGTAEVF